MKTVEQRSPVQYSPRRQSMWALADYGGQDLWNGWVLSLEWNSECVMEGESGEQVGGELASVTSLLRLLLQQTFGRNPIFWFYYFLYGVLAVNRLYATLIIFVY